jgi:tetratricopeptide (TPR) repeat protein
MRGPNSLPVLLACGVLVLAGASRAADAPAASDAPGLPSQLAPLHLDADEVRLWNEGIALETEERLEESIERYTKLARMHPSSPFLAWRVARNHWRRGELLPVDAKEKRHEAYSAALAWAERAVAADPECGECVFWKMAAMGRLATTVGVIESASMAPEIAALIDRGIALNPTYSDTEWNHTLANLYFASSAFYRITPDWMWLDWVLGVRGDKDRALEYIERALEIAPMRVDYTLEHGVVLTCIGVERDDAAALSRGRSELRKVGGMRRIMGTDAIDKQNAALLLRRPELACGYSRDGFVDFSEARRAGAL